MTINAENLSVCQEALYLLRQDVGIPSVASAPTDDSLEWQKCRMAFDPAIAEVWGAHDWNAELKLTGADLTAAPASVVKWSTAMRTALAYCLARELAIPLAGRVQDLKNWTELYAEKLAKARAWSLERERAAVTDPIHREILTLIAPRFTESPDLPRSVKSITDRADTLSPQARYTVLAAHAWNFARTEEKIAPCSIPHGDDPYGFSVELPAGCVHVEALLTHGGRITDWKIFGRTAVSRDPVTGIVYVRDDRKPEKWPPLVHRAFLFRLAADVAQTEMPQLMAAMEQKYGEALAEAKVRDSRESNTPKDAWGANHYVEAMRGARPGGPHLPRHSFHGLV